MFPLFMDQGPRLCHLDPALLLLTLPACSVSNTEFNKDSPGRPIEYAYVTSLRLRMEIDLSDLPLRCLDNSKAY